MQWNTNNIGYNLYNSIIYNNIKDTNMKMEKSASFHDYGIVSKNSSVYLGIEPLLQRAASTGDAQLLLTLLQVVWFAIIRFGSIFIITVITNNYYPF